MGAIRILHTNDFHGCLTESKFETLSTLRKETDLYFDTGDAIKAGNLAIPLAPDPVWPRLAALECTASVPGNRESQPIASAFHKKLEGAIHPILCANLTTKDGSWVLPPHLILEEPFRIGVFGVMVPIVTAKMATAPLSAYLWSQPIEAARQQVAELRPQVDLLIALTHIGLSRDRELAEKVPGIDLIIGGHSHDVLEQPLSIGKTSIVQAGSHGRYAGILTWESGVVSHRLISLS